MVSREINDDAFIKCTQLKGILTIGSNVTIIHDTTFKGFSKMIGPLITPDSVEYIGSNAFADCSGFESLTLSNPLTNISWSTFSGCLGFKGELIIPELVTNISQIAFSRCHDFSGDLIILDSVILI